MTEHIESTEAQMAGTWQDVMAVSAEAEVEDADLFTFVRKVKVTLTDAELAAYAKQAASADAEVKDLKEERKSITESIKSGESRRTVALEAVTTGKGDREVPCRRVEREHGLYEFYDRDGQLQGTEPMSESDRQPELPFDDLDDASEDDARATDDDGNDDFDDAELITEPEAILANDVGAEAPPKAKRGRKKAAS